MRHSTYIFLLSMPMLSVGQPVFNGVLQNLVAGEAITAPAWVYVTPEGAMLKADGSDATKPAMGLVLQSVSSGATGQAYFSGFVSNYPATLTVGAQYLSASTPGSVTAVRPSPAAQLLGYAVSSSAMSICPSARTVSEHYAVGAVYVSTVATNPADLLGYGTWAAFGAGRALVGIDVGQAEFDAAEEVGGAKTHTLTVSEIPAHTHTYTSPDAPQSVIPVGLGVNNSLPSRTEGTATGSTGGGAPHNNLQPYIVVYFWKRTG